MPICRFHLTGLLWRITIYNFEPRVGHHHRKLTLRLCACVCVLLDDRSHSQPVRVRVYVPTNLDLICALCASRACGQGEPDYREDPT